MAQVTKKRSFKDLMSEDEDELPPPPPPQCSKCAHPSTGRYHGVEYCAAHREEARAERQQKAQERLVHEQGTATREQASVAALEQDLVRVNGELAAWQEKVTREFLEIRAILATIATTPVAPSSALVERVKPILDRVVRRSQDWNGVAFGQQCLDLLSELDPAMGATAKTYVEETILPRIAEIQRRKAEKQKTSKRTK